MDFTRWVDPFIGVDGGGNTLCGPYLPFSLVRLSPDTHFFNEQQTNGYRSDQPIRHFSHTHVSGTGGGSRYGNIGVIPFVGHPCLHPGPFEKKEEIAAAGYYSVVLIPGQVRVELTSTPRVGVHRYHFPESENAYVKIDAGAVLQMGGMVPGDRREDGTGACIGGCIEQISPHELVGRGDFRGGWGHTYPYSVFFYARFDRPCSSSVVGNHFGIHPADHADGRGCFAILGFGKTNILNLKVGISYCSIARARKSVDVEVDDDSFEHTRMKAVSCWNEVLSKIKVQGGTEEDSKLFYTSLYRLFCMPTDLGVDDEFSSWRSGIGHFTDYYTLWDSVRNANSLLMLIDTPGQVAQLNCLLDIADHTGWLPDVWIQGHHGMIQGGSSSDILFCEAALKGIVGIDYQKALKYMRKDAEEESPDPYCKGRYLQDYNTLGYVSTSVKKNSVSRHLEYAYQDWCVGNLAEKLRELEITADYRKRAEKLWNLWREDLKCFAPRLPSGEWVNPFDQDFSWQDSWNDPYFYEGTSRQWSFSTHQDFHGLISRHGGPDAFIQHLDDFFGDVKNPVGTQTLPWLASGMGHYHSKETMLHIPWLYHYAGRSDLGNRRVRQCLRRFFQPTRNGLHDNEDYGCQSAFFICSSMGLYPIMGQSIYLLGSPLFEDITISLSQTQQTLHIHAEGAGDRNLYIKSAVLNGNPLNKSWISHEELIQGGSFIFQLSGSPCGFGHDIPPP